MNRFTGSFIDIDGNMQTQNVDAENLIQAQLKFENLWNFKRLLTIVPASKMRMNKAFHELLPNNCALIELTGDGIEVGTCGYYCSNGVCPRHGDWMKLVRKEAT